MPLVHITQLDISKVPDGNWRLTQAVIARAWGSLTDLGMKMLKHYCERTCRPPVQGAYIYQDGEDVRVCLTAFINSDAEAHSEETKKQFDTSSQAVLKILQHFRNPVVPQKEHYRWEPADYLDDGNCPPWV